MFWFPKKKGVDYILSTLDLNIPKYEIVSKEENWQDYYDYTISFPKADSASIRKQVENIPKNDGLLRKGYLNQYEFDGKSYDIIYSSSEEIDPGDYHYFALITPQEGTAILRMDSEWGEQLMCSIYAILLFWLGFAIGVIYLLVLLVVKYFHHRPSN